MYSKFTRVIIASLVIIITFVLTVNSQPVKRVLLEQHTGAWCGWCVDGSYVVEQIHNKYPDTFIGVKIHNNYGPDSMAIPEEDTLADDFNSHSYPQGSIDRFDWTGTNSSPIIGRDLWMSKVEIALTEEPKVDVNLVYSINEQTRELYATLTATMLETINEELHFNCYIVEDSVSGTGSGWDQSNQLSGLAGYEDNPYYDLPNPIVGYQHMNVVRKMLGGTYGEQGSFTIPAESGQFYIYNFSFTLDPGWKIKDIKLVGLVQMFTSSKRTLNASWGYVGEPKMPKFTVTSTQPETNKIVGKGESFKKTFTLKNITDAEVTYTIDAVKSTRTPADWTVDIELPSIVSGKTKINGTTEELTLAPQQSSDFILKLTHGPTLGFGDATVTIGVKDDPEAIVGKRTITIISTEIERFEVLDDAGSDKYGLQPAIIQSGRNDFIVLSSSEFIDNKSLFTNMKTLVWNCGLEGNLAAEELQLLKDNLDSGKAILLTGANIARSTGGANIDFFSGNKGIAVDYFKDSEIGANDEEFTLTGMSNDPVTNNFEQTCKKIKYKTPSLVISNMIRAYPILQHKDTDTVVATRYAFQGKKAVYLAILPEIILDETERNNLIKKSLDWLEETTDVDDNTGAGVLSVSAMPNPVNNKTNIKYTLAGEKPMFVDMFLVDVNGKKVASIMRRTLTQGEYTYEYDASVLASGSYYIVTLIDDDRLITPVAISR